MADIRISQLPSAQSAITGAELVPIVQNGLTVQTTVAAITQSPNQTQPFLTVGQQPTLPNSRYFSAINGIGITDGGAQGAYTIQLNGTSSSLETVSTGIIAKTAANTVAARTLTASGNGISVANGDGISGNPTFALTGLALALANASGTGLTAINGSALSPVTITGTPNQIGVVNGNGVGNPTVSIVSNPVIPGTGSIQIPAGSSALRPSIGVNSMFRYNSDLGAFEGYINSSWAQLVTNSGGGVGVTSVAANGGTTGLTFSGSPITSSGTLVLGGTLGATSGGTGQNTYATGDLLYASAANTLSKLAASTNGYVLTLSGGVPTWAASTGGVTSFSAGTTGFTPSTGTTGAVTLAGTLNVANGGTGVTTSTGTGSVVLGTRPTLAVTGAGFTLQDGTDNTKQANFGLAGLTTGTTYSYNLPAVSGAALATLGNITQAFSGAVSFSNNFDINGNGNVTIGPSTGTATLTFGQSTVSQTTNIQAGATASGSTKTINIGTGGLTGSTTNVNIGSAAGTTTTTINNNLTVVGQFNCGFGAFALQGASGYFGQTTGTGTYGFGTGATASGSTKTLSIGNGGLAGSTTTIAIGSAAGTSTTALNGTISLGGAPGAESLRVTPIASAVNYLQVTGNTVGNAPILVAQGSDTNINVLYSTKGSGAHYFQSNTNGNNQFVISSSAASVNYLQVAGSGTGDAPYIYGTGSDANVGIKFSSKGNATTVFYSNTFASAQFTIAHTASAVNYLQVTGAATGTAVTMSAQGSDTDISISASPKGVGVFTVNTTTAITVPVGTTAQRPTGATGMFRYNSTTAGFEGFNGTAWGAIGGGSNITTLGLWENANTISANYTIGTGNNAMSAGPITIASGVTVTIPSGSTWVVN